MHIAKDQADFVIIQLARVLKEEFSNTVVIVLSCDYDFIALAPPNSVDVLLDPTCNVILWKRDVLALLGVEEETLFIAYTLGGGVMISPQTCEVLGSTEPSFYWIHNGRI